MITEIQYKVGPQVLSDGSIGIARGGKAGESVMTNLHGRYYEQAYRRNLFTAYAAAVATSLVGTGMVGLQVWNGSSVSAGVNLVLLRVGGFCAVTTAAATGLLLATGSGQVAAPTGQTAVTRVTNNYISGAAPQATATNAGTFTSAPTAILTLMHNTVAIATTGEDPGYQFDLEGSIIIPPQSYVCVASLGAALAASGGFHYIMWEEVPL
jgi:hypothetical protein